MGGRQPSVVQQVVRRLVRVVNVGRVIQVFIGKALVRVVQVVRQVVKVVRVVFLWWVPLPSLPCHQDPTLCHLQPFQFQGQLEP